jgi:hypothetical protein
MIKPEQPDMIAGQSGLIEQIEKTEQHLGAGTVEIGQRNIDRNRRSLAFVKVLTGAIKYRGKKCRRVFRVGFPFHRQSMVIESEIHLRRIWGGGDM